MTNEKKTNTYKVNHQPLACREAIVSVVALESNFIVLLYYYIIVSVTPAFILLNPKANQWL